MYGYKRGPSTRGHDALAAEDYLSVKNEELLVRSRLTQIVKGSEVSLTTRKSVIEGTSYVK